MKYPIQIAFILFLTASLSAQTSRMTNPEVAREYSTAQQATTIFPLLQKAERELQVLDFEEAFFTLENAVAQNPNSPEALMARAVLKKRMGMGDEAQMDFNLAKKLNPYIGQIYGYNGNKNLLALLAFSPEKAVQSIAPEKNLNYYFQFIDQKYHRHHLSDNQYIELASIINLIETNNLDLVQLKIDTLISELPNTAILFDLKGAIYLKKEDFINAKKYFKLAIENEPNFAIAWYNLGVVNLKMDELKASKYALDKAIELETNLTKAYFERALLLKKMGDEESAIQDYNTIIDKAGYDYLQAYLNRGLTKKMLGDFNGALKDLDFVIKNTPDSAELYKNRGNLYLLFGLTRKAIDDYTKAIQLDENYAEAHYNRSMAHFKIYDMISGCRDLRNSKDLNYEKAIEVEPFFCY